MEKIVIPRRQRERGQSTGQIGAVPLRICPKKDGRRLRHRRRLHLHLRHHYQHYYPWLRVCCSLLLVQCNSAELLPSQQLQ